jgi:hypothetical protein
MESLHRNDWGFIGISAEAVYSIGNTHAVLQSVTSGGLWGIESDSDRTYFEEIESDISSTFQNAIGSNCSYSRDSCLCIDDYFFAWRNSNQFIDLDAFGFRFLLFLF